MRIEQLKEILHRLTRLEEAIADLKPNIKMLPIVRKLYLDGVELRPPYDAVAAFPHPVAERRGRTAARAVQSGSARPTGAASRLMRQQWRQFRIPGAGMRMDRPDGGCQSRLDRHGQVRYAGHAVTIVKHRVTREDVNHLLTVNGFTGELDLLSVDIDGNDYWVFEALTVLLAPCRRARVQLAVRSGSRRDGSLRRRFQGWGVRHAKLSWCVTRRRFHTWHTAKATASSPPRG